MFEHIDHKKQVTILFSIQDLNLWDRPTWLVLSNRPLYTLPKPPSPKRQSALKYLVAAANSRNVNVCAAMCPD